MLSVTGVCVLIAGASLVWGAVWSLTFILRRTVK